MNQNTKNMLAGKPYYSNDPELAAWQQSAHQLCRQYNQSANNRSEIINQMLPNHGRQVTMAGPIYFDYGRFTTIGDNFYANFNFTVLDTCPVKIGNHCMFGPNVTLATAYHPLLPEQRNPHVTADGTVQAAELGAPITIGDNVWCGANVTVLPGVTIGDNCVIGAGAVVTHDLPANHVAMGVPAKAVRELTAADRRTDWPY